MIDATSELSAHLTTGAVIVYAIEAAKKSTWFPWLHAETKTLNRLVSAVLAAAAAFGIHASFDAVAGTLIITGLTWAGVLGAAWAWLQQWVLQQIVFDSVIATKEKRPS